VFAMLTGYWFTPLPGPLPQGERERGDQEPVRIHCLIPRPDRKRSIYSKSTSPRPLRERARERGYKTRERSEHLNTLEPTISMADHGR